MVSAHVIYATVPISVIVALCLLRKWRSRSWPKCMANTCLRGKTFLITGANSGLGLETARALVKRKARVIFACRDVNKAKAAIADVRADHPNGGELISMQLDLASFESIEKFVEVVKAGFYKIDVLINNAGVVVPLNEDLKTKEGFEIHFGVNHLGHFYLTQLLLGLLKRATPSRIVIISSSSRVEERGKINFDDLNLKADIEVAKKGKAGLYNPGYCNSKLMNAYFMRALADKLRGSGIDVNACCPGFCYTNLFRSSIKWYHYILFPIFFLYMRSAKQGSETVVFCATDYSIEGKTGKFYRDCTEYTSKYPYDKDVEAKLWEVSEELVASRKPL